MRGAWTRSGLVGAVCAAVGFLAGVTAGTGSAPDVEPPAERSAVPQARDPVVEAGRGPRRMRPAEPSTPASPGASAPPGAAGARPAADPVEVDTARLAEVLRKRTGGEPPPARLDQAETRAHEIRERSLATARNAEVAAASQVAEEIAKERALVADAARGGTLELLRKLASSPVRAFDLVGSPDRFGERFVRRTEGPVLDGTTRPGPSALADGALVRFPGGVHAWSVSQLGRSGGVFPKDVLVEGAGMDRTLVRLDEIESSTAIDVLTFRDLTIDCGGESLADLGGEPMILSLERCRVIGFDGTRMLSVHAGAFRATECRFEAGWGPSPGRGTLFAVRGFLARCDSCVFVGPFESVLDDERGATYVFADCRFESMKRGFARTVASPPECARFERCTVTEMEGDEPSFDTTSLFPILFSEPAGGVTVSGVGGGDLPKDVPAATVVFPPGAHALDGRVSQFQGDLVIVGQGRDTTLVRVQSAPRARRVFWRDLAIDGSGADPVPSSRAYVSFERCRFVAYDTGSGGSTAIDFRGDGAVRVVDCRFDEGFGRSPGLGTAVCVYDVPTRADRCVFALAGGSAVRRGSSVVLADCAITGLDAQEFESLRSGKSRVRLVRTTLEALPAGSTHRPERRPLMEINPSWGGSR